MTRFSSCSWVRGRPGLRFSCPSYFWAISFRCHASRVSGVTKLATSARSLRPKPLARTANRRRWFIEPHSTVTELFPQHSILFSQVLDRLLPALIHPSGNRHEQELKGIEHSRHSFSFDSPKPPSRVPTNSHFDGSNIRAIRDRACQRDCERRGFGGTLWLTRRRMTKRWGRI